MGKHDRQEEETRNMSETGGQKGIKINRFDLIDSCFLWELSKVYGVGAEKYDEQNWRKGYPFSWSAGALQRHLHQFLMGEEVDGETGCYHIVQAAWHCIALFVFSTNQEYKQFDDRVDSAPNSPKAPTLTAPGFPEEAVLAPDDWKEYNRLVKHYGIDKPDFDWCSMNSCDRQQYKELILKYKIGPWKE